MCRLPPPIALLSPMPDATKSYSRRSTRSRRCDRSPAPLQRREAGPSCGSVHGANRDRAERRAPGASTLCLGQRGALDAGRGLKVKVGHRELTIQWTILLASISRWRKPTSAFLIVMALLSTRQIGVDGRRDCKRVGESAELSSGRIRDWTHGAVLFHGLSQLGVPVVCVESRQAYHALKSLATHKSDRNDARGLAHLARTGFFKPGRPAGDPGESDPRPSRRVRVPASLRAHRRVHRSSSQRQAREWRVSRSPCGA